MKRIVVIAVFVVLLALAPAASAVNLVFVGDSLTGGLFATSPELAFTYLVDPLAPKFGAVNIEAAVAYADDIRALEPHAVVIELGTNDSSGYPTMVPTDPVLFEAHYRALLDSIGPVRKLVLLGVWKTANGAVYDPIIRRLAYEYGGRFESLVRISTDPRYYLGSLDDWHPNDAGHAAIAHLVKNALGRGKGAMKRRARLIQLGLITLPR